MWERTIRFRSMRNKPEVERRVKILGFWKEHGTRATEDAFDVSERTLFRWQAALGENQGHLDALDPKSTAPKNKRKRVILAKVEEVIIQERTAHPRYGKKKLKVFLILRDDVSAFNLKLVDWLLWYNTRRPHWSLGLISPLRYICNQLSVEKSQMCWTSTKT